MASSSSISASLSQNGSTVAVSSVHSSSSNSSNGALRVLLFQVGTGLLQTTLKYRPTDTDNTSTSTSTSAGITKVLFVGDTVTAAVCQDKLVVWDLTRGVVAYTVPCKADQQFIDAVTIVSNNDDNDTSNMTDNSIAVLVQTKDKVQIHQFAAATGKLVRKIKVGKHAEGISLAAVTANNSSTSKKGKSEQQHYLIVHRKESLVVLNATTGEKVSKFSGLVATETATPNVNVLAAVDNVAATISAGQVVLVHIETGAKIDIGTSSAGGGNNAASNSLVVHDEAAGLQMFQTASGDTMLLVDGTRLFRIPVVDTTTVQHKNSKKGKKDNDNQERSFSCQPKAVSKFSLASDIDGFATVSGAGASQSHLVAVLYQAGKFQVQTLPLMKPSDDKDGGTSMNSQIAVAWNTPEQASASKQQAETTSSSSKRKVTETNSLTVLGPGQAGGEARTTTDGPASKKKRTLSGDSNGDNDEEMDENDNAEGEGPTIAERLELLQKAMDDDKFDDSDDEDDDGDDDKAKDAVKARLDSLGFSVKKATTESLTQVLQQALQSADDAMLELALSVRDPTVLAETCQELSSEYLPVLLTALTTRLASKPARAEHLCQWLSVILQSGKIRSPEHVQPLRNLIQERLEVFPSLLKLDGRLSMMKSL